MALNPIANRLPPQIETLIVRLKREYPGSGVPKIRERLRRRYPAPLCPAISTVHAVLDRHGFVKRRRAKGAVKQVDEQIGLVSFLCPEWTQARWRACPDSNSSCK